MKRDFSENPTKANTNSLMNIFILSCVETSLIITYIQTIKVQKIGVENASKSI